MDRHDPRTCGRHRRRRFLFKGTVKIPLHRFFAAITIILWLVAAHLAITGLHELSEARWLPSSKQEMAIIGPIVRNELFFFVFIFGAAMLLILREWLTPSAPKTPLPTMPNAVSLSRNAGARAVG